MDELEIWQEIPGMSGFQASNLGQIRDYRGSLPVVISQRGFPCVQIYNLERDCWFKFSVIGLVARAFLDPKPEDRTIKAWNRDGDRLNNRADNLYYATREQAILDGATEPVKRAGASKLTEAAVRDILRAAAGQQYFLKWGVPKYAKKYGVSETTIRHVLNRRT